MVEVAHYEEKQYEIALLFELAAASPHFFPSGQALEKALGYDFAIAPAKLSIWELLHVGMPPGIALTPGLWTGPTKPDAGRLPTQFVSLIVQAKRPQKVNHWSGGQHHYWRGPYFRFYTDSEQQDVLVRLEKAVAPNGFVRYACGAFLEYHELLQHQSASEVAEHSTFVSPTQLFGHRLWSFARAGTDGYANPEGERARSDSVSTLLEAARSAARPQTLSEHLLALGAAAETLDERAPRRWAEVLLSATIGVEAGAAVDVAVAWATFAGAVARVGGSWLVLGFEVETD